MAGGSMASYALNEEKMFSDIADGIAIVINSETGIYYGMNGFGTAVFENLLNGAPTEKIVEVVKAYPDAPADLDERMANFVKALEEFEIVIPGEAREVDIVLDPSVAAADEYELRAEEFNDAQELLLADPIHEVKEDTGWQPDKSALETDEDVVKEKTKKQI